VSVVLHRCFRDAWHHHGGEQRAAFAEKLSS
jgi:hypothetical protein